MIAKNRTEEMVFHLMRSKKKSFYFGEISLGVQKLLDALKARGLVVYFSEKNGNPETILLTKEECEQQGIEFEHCLKDLSKTAY